MAKNRERQRENRRKKYQQEEFISYRNHEQYNDPTAFLAIRSMMLEERRLARRACR